MSNLTHWTRTWAESQQIPTWFDHQTTSTNDIARQQLGSTGTATGTVKQSLFLTEHQTQGRGRGTNTWSDDSHGNNLICSWVLPLELPAQHISGPVFGYALFEALKTTWPSLDDLSLKAPNDLYLNQKKLAGILLESVSQGGEHSLIFGLGMNVFSSPEQIENSMSLSQVTGDISETQWQAFLSELFRQMQRASDLCQKPSLSDEFCRKITPLLKLSQPYLGRSQLGEFKEIDRNGNLIFDNEIIAWSAL